MFGVCLCLVWGFVLWVGWFGLFMVALLLVFVLLHIGLVCCFWCLFALRIGVCGCGGGLGAS